jgi:hypothetical protein
VQGELGLGREQRDSRSDIAFWEPPLILAGEEGQ